MEGRANHTSTFVGALQYFKPFLAGVPFSVITDSSAQSKVLKISESPSWLTMIVHSGGGKFCVSRTPFRAR